MNTRVRVRVTGIVQGVGFRPFVHALAGSLGLSGQVGNDESGVLIEAQGDRAAIRKFLAELAERPPALAVVERVDAVRIPVLDDAPGFRIAASSSEGQRGTLVSPDTATCPDCLAELADPTDRRYRYPFINCTNCGPRFTIVTGVPYDRAATTMAGFPMCARCAAEYHDPSNRRFHAQPVCCPACGPSVQLLPGAGLDQSADPDSDLDPDPILAAAALLRSGAILAVKGLGGFHLAALAGGPVGQRAVARLRGRKHREDKPFAVLVGDVAAARRLVRVGPAAEELLTGRRRPIVLMPRLPSARLADAVAPGNRSLGVLLPYTPLHHLLAAAVAEPLVLTSGNISDEPIAYRDEDAMNRLAPIADGFLTHNRPIHTRVDDSVLRVVGGRPVPIRRARGYAPEPLAMAWPAPRQVLGCGAQLKSTFCLARGSHAFVSPHIGDLENYETLRSYTEGIAHYRELFDLAPAVLAHDLHPDYLSTTFAQGYGEEAEAPIELLGLQHHHAHLASCLADNGVDGPVLGVACDGLGYGTDGTLWGGELMAVSLASFRRLAFLEPVPMPGGAAAVREPWRMAAAYLRLGYGAGQCPPGARAMANRQGARWAKLDALLAVADGELGLSGAFGWSPAGPLRGASNAPLTSSAGRLFDAVAALLGLRDRVNYEGQAAVELEQAVDPAEREWYPVRQEGPLIKGVDLVRGVVEDLAAGNDAGVIAARFHNGMVEALAQACVRARAETGLGVVALSGGVFQNEVLSRRLVARLNADGFEVLTHRRVPPNDAGISFGQVAIAAARDRELSGKWLS
jgi:hydrogenase maturation protein HypF